MRAEDWIAWIVPQLYKSLIKLHAEPPPLFRGR
jgi:hypothetical protein